MARYPWLGAEFHCLPLQGKRGHIGKGDALERSNYRGLKLTEQVMKVLERIVDSLIRQLVSIDNSQFGFVPGRGTTDAISVCQAATREVSGCQQETLHGCRPGEGIWSNTSEGHLVGAEKTWCGVDCATSAGDVSQMHRAVSILVRGTVKSLKWRLVFTKVQY